MVDSSRAVWMFALVLTSVAFHQAQASGSSMTVYAMAVGQGDGNIILCPNSKDVLIVDMGAKNPIFNTRDYGTYLLKEKFGVVSQKKNIHIVVSHPHNDHYNQLTWAIDSELIPRVSEIVLGGSISDYSRYFVKWLSGSSFPVYTINNGTKCFGNDQCMWTKAVFPSISSSKRVKRATSGDPWQFCGSDVTITALGANIGITEDLNMKSVILKLVYKQWSLLMSGDFEGKRQQTELLNRWPNELQSTYYKVAHHGSWTAEYEANLPELLAKIRPKRVYVSHGYPSLSTYHHPNCQTLQHLMALGTIDTVKGGLNTPYVCWNDTTNSVLTSPVGDGYAIYETCRMEKSSKQVCKDIMIETDGVNDQTHFVDVPSKYIR